MPLFADLKNAHQRSSLGLEIDVVVPTLGAFLRAIVAAKYRSFVGIKEYPAEEGDFWTDMGELSSSKHLPGGFFRFQNKARVINSGTIIR